MMMLRRIVLAALGAGAVLAGSGPAADADGKYWIYGDGVSAAFVPYGASVANLLVRDRYGIERDVVAGFDKASSYSSDKVHPHLGSVPGRYANRIRNSSFELDGRRFHLAANENPTAERPDGIDTLHGGPNGWDWRNFSVLAHSRSSITMSLVDADGQEGFPGEVIALVTYSLTGRDWDLRMVAVATTRRTPIMLSSHTYWNLDGFANNETRTALNHSMHMPYAGQRIAVDGILVPTGDLVPNPRGSVNDFWSRPKQLGASFGDPELEGNCGTGCTGYDNCFINGRAALGNYDWRSEGPVATLASAWSGIRLDIFSDQEAMQLYSCNQQNGTMALKTTQGRGTIPPYGCVVVEVQDYIDGINHPEWGRERKQVFGPADDPYLLRARYRFSVA